MFAMSLNANGVGDLNILRPPRLNELTPFIFDIELTHLGSETSNCYTIVNIIVL